VFLPLRFRLAASSFAIVFLLVFAYPINVAITPNAGLYATFADALWLCNPARDQPALQRDFVNPQPSGNLSCGIGLHYATYGSVFQLTRQAPCGRIGKESKARPENSGWEKVMDNRDKKRAREEKPKKNQAVE
jgi:hypothetical protein